MGSISKRDEPPLQPILEVELFNIWGMDFMGPFPSSFSNLLIRLCQVGVRNQQNLYPRIPTTDVAKLLQYSDSRVEHRDGLSS